MLTDSSEDSARPGDRVSPPAGFVSVSSDVQKTPAAATAAAAVWGALAPLLAGRPRVRVSRDRRHFFHKWERPLTGNLPAQPAAVPVYGADGTTRVLVVDLDRSRGGRAQVLADCQRVTELIHRCGGRVIVDESPSGGRHVYVPLAQAIDFYAARDFAVDLAAQTPSMDPTPHQNLSDGLIRPPGSVHRSGGHQILVGSLTAAVDVATARNPPALWPRLRRAVEPRPSAASVDAASPADNQPVRARPGRTRPLGSDYLAIATTGLYDTTRYPTPSHVRGAVVLAAANAGMTLTDVLARLADGTWRGLAALYAAKCRRPGARTRAVRHDWNTAAATIAARPPQRPGETLVRKSPTNVPTPHRGEDLAGPKIETGQRQRANDPDEYRFFRTWDNALRVAIQSGRWGRDGIGKRLVLKALAEAAMMTSSRYLAFGTRSYSVATGMDHTTVAAHLRELRDEADPFIVLIENERGLNADLYELRIPDSLLGRAERQAWRPGKIHSLRPVFRELGPIAAAAYDALEHAPGPLSSFELAAGAGIGRTSAYEALETLAAWNLARPDRAGRWQIVRQTCLARLAEAWGIVDSIGEQIERHRAERAAYRRALRIPDYPDADIALAGWAADEEAAGSWTPAPPPDPLDTALDLLQRELGGARIPLRTAAVGSMR